MYPQYLAGMTDLTLLAPDLSLLGDKKRPADTEAVGNWLAEQAAGADYALVSIDMLLYGGIVPSRLHTFAPDTLRIRLDTLRRMKKANPRLRVYAFHLITRAPAYSSSEEEPDYYADYGREIYENGWLSDKEEREGLSAEERERMDLIRSRIPEPILTDFLARRQTNAFMNSQSIELVEEGIIDYMIIPLDDNSKYGYTSSDQRRIAAKVEHVNLAERITIYPGADEIGCTLFARIFSEVKQFTPLFHVRYSSTNGPFVIPKYEDRSLHESIKCHLTAAGAILGDGSGKADVRLMVHSPPVGQTDMAETMEPYESRHRAYFSEVNIREFAQTMRFYASKGELIALADVALCNGGDHSLMKLLSDAGLLPSISCYAAWNTSGNALGTVIAHAVIESCNRTRSNKDPQYDDHSKRYCQFRLIEDWGYQSLVRQDVSRNDLPPLAADDFRLTHVQSIVEARICSKLEQFAKQYLPKGDQLRIEHVRLPWRRMFEVEFELSEQKE